MNLFMNIFFANFLFTSQGEFFFLSLTSFCYFYFTATATRWQREPWRTQPTIDWKWPKALRDYPVLLPDLGPGTMAAVPWIFWNTFFTFTTWCCLYVSSLSRHPRAKRREYFISETSTQECALIQMKDRGPWNLLSRFTRESLPPDGPLCTLRRSYFNSSLVFPSSLYNRRLSVAKREITRREKHRGVHFSELFTSIAYDSKA